MCGCRSKQASPGRPGVASRSSRGLQRTVDELCPFQAGRFQTEESMHGPTPCRDTQCHTFAGSHARRCRIRPSPALVPVARGRSATPTGPPPKPVTLPSPPGPARPRLAPSRAVQTTPLTWPSESGTRTSGTARPPSWPEGQETAGPEGYRRLTPPLAAQRRRRPRIRRSETGPGPARRGSLRCRPRRARPPPCGCRHADIACAGRVSGLACAGRRGPRRRAGPGGRRPRRAGLAHYSILWHMVEFLKFS